MLQRGLQIRPPKETAFILSVNKHPWATTDASSTQGTMTLTWAPSSGIIAGELTHEMMDSDTRHITFFICEAFL